MYKKIIRKCLSNLGLDLIRLSPSTNPAFQLFKGLSHFGVTVVLDVGANVGQFGTSLRDVGFDGRIVSFEPLSEAHAALVTSARSDARWKVHPRCAIGTEAGEININIAGNSVSSSVLPMLASHSEAAAGSAYVGAERVPLLPLDDAAADYLTAADRAFVKIDTQGYEWQVLDGAEQTLAGAAGVLCELSLVPLYEGQKLWRDVIARLEEMGFTLWAIQKGFTDPRDGRTLQLDAIFFRTGKLDNSPLPAFGTD